MDKSSRFYISVILIIVVACVTLLLNSIKPSDSTIILGELIMLALMINIYVFCDSDPEIYNLQGEKVK